jgi:hypothetical protein
VKCELKKLEERLEVFMEDETSDFVTQNGDEKGSGQTTQTRKPNRAAEVGLRKLIFEHRKHLLELQEAFELRNSKNRMNLDREGLLEMVNVIMMVAATVLPATKDQSLFRRTLAGEFARFSKGMFEEEDLNKTIEVKPDNGGRVKKLDRVKQQEKLVWGNFFVHPSAPYAHPEKKKELRKIPQPIDFPGGGRSPERTPLT